MVEEQRYLRNRSCTLPRNHRQLVFVIKRPPHLTERFPLEIEQVELGKYGAGLGWLGVGSMSTQQFFKNDLAGFAEAPVAPWESNQTGSWTVERCLRKLQGTD
jgi:hypothetical protein